MKLVNKTGYLKGAKTAKNPVNIIPSNLITTQGMAFPIKANGKTLYPNTGQYKFPTSPVIETPLRKKNQIDTSTTGPTIDKANLLKTKTNNNSSKLGSAFFAKPKPFTWKPPKNVAEFEKVKRKSSSKTAANRYKKEDTFEDNIIELLDLTGASSWDDVQRNIDKEGFTPETYLEMAGAIPLFGRIPKLIRGRKLISQIAKAAIKGTEVLEKGSNAPELYKSYQEGVNKLEGDLISKVIMNRNKDKDFVQRAYAVGKNPKSLMFTKIGNPEEPPYQTKETHRMGWGEDDKGQTYMYPDIMNPNNEAVKVPNQYADYISSKGYKKATGMSYQKGTKKTKTFNFTPNTSLAGDNTVNTQGREDAKSTKFNLQKTKDFNAAEAAGAMTGDKGAEDKFYARYGEGSGKFKYDTDSKYAAQMDKNLKAAEKAKQPILRENVKLDPNAMFMLPAGLKDRKAAKDYQDFHKEVILNALPIPKVPKFLRQGKNTSKVNFSKYLTQEEAVAARAKRLLSQKNKTGWNEQLTPELEERLSTAVERHNPASDYPGEKLGANTLGRTATEVSKNANLKGVPLNEANKARIAAHETGHYYANSPKEGVEWLSHFNLHKLPYKTKVYFRGKGRSNNYGNEIRERAAQLKDYIAQKNNIPLDQDFTISKSQLNDALKNYVKDTKLDNAMSPMLSSLTNKKGFLNTMNKYPLSIIPVAGATGAAAVNSTTQEKRNGAKTLKYKKGSKGVSLAFSRGEKDPKGGLTQKGVDKYNRATGGNLKMAVTTPPSKLKAGSKDANRRKSFCARSAGQMSKFPKAAKDPNSRLRLARKKWNC